MNGFQAPAARPTSMSVVRTAEPGRWDIWSGGKGLKSWRLFCSLLVSEGWMNYGKHLRTDLVRGFLWGL